jgi:hypothetical protein
MADALSALPRGLEATQTVLPRTFNWPLFCVALTLMALPVAQAAWQFRHQPRTDMPAVLKGCA